jgi:zinc protease
MDKIKLKGVTLEEVSQLIHQYHANKAYGRDGSENVIDILNEWISAGDWTEYVRYDAAISKVTPADVQRVAQKYMNAKVSTTGWYVPEVVP